MSQAGDYLAGPVRHKEESRAVKSSFSILCTAFLHQLQPGISATAEDFSGIMPGFILASLGLTLPFLEMHYCV